MTLRRVARVTLDNVSKTFRGPRGEAITALRDLSLAVEDRELLVLVGPSGSGKTTVLRLIAGLEEVTHGTITLGGQTVNDTPADRRDIAMVFQGHALFPHLTVFDNLALGLRLRRFARAEIERRVGEAAATLGLTACLPRRPAALSGGERQRVALGRALVRRPRVFLLDEPLSSLDAPLRAQMRAELARLHASLGTTMIYVTHDQAEAMTLGQRVAVLQGGVLQQVATPRTLYRQPANMFVAGFMGSPPMNLVRGRLAEAEGRLRFTAEPTGPGDHGGFSLDLPAGLRSDLGRQLGKPVVLGARAEHLRVALQGPKASGGLVARVDWTETLGAETIVHLRLGSLEVAARMSGDHALAPGASVTVEFDLEHALFFEPGTGQAIAGGG